jgi:hypothetical protein
MEVSLDEETELLVELSLLWLSLPLVSIHNIPLLLDLVVLVVDTDVSVLSISGALNLNDLASLVDNI